MRSGLHGSKAGSMTVIVARRPGGMATGAGGPARSWWLVADRAVPPCGAVDGSGSSAARLAVGKEPEVSNANQSPGQNVQQEAAQELIERKRS